jgi:hypothetical protein
VLTRPLEELPDGAIGEVTNRRCDYPTIRCTIVRVEAGLGSEMDVGAAYREPPTSPQSVVGVNDLVERIMCARSGREQRTWRSSLHILGCAAGPRPKPEPMSAEEGNHSAGAASAAQVTRAGGQSLVQGTRTLRVRVGRGVSYFLLGYLAINVALRGRSSPQASSQGALNEVAS